MINYQTLVIGFQVTVENVGDAFLGHSVDLLETHTGVKHSKSNEYYSHKNKFLAGL